MSATTEQGEVKNAYRLEISLDIRVDLGVGDIVLRRVSDLVKQQSARGNDDSARR
jgi:hypothetical protein